MHAVLDQYGESDSLTKTVSFLVLIRNTSALICFRLNPFANR